MNKRISKIALASILVLVFSLSAFALVACGDISLEQQIKDLQDKLHGYEETDAEKSIVVYVGDDKIEVVTKQNKMFLVLTEMLESGKITNFDSNNGANGAFITGINDMVVGVSSYISVYHTIDKAELKDLAGSWVDGIFVPAPGGGYKEITHKSVTFFYSNVGVSALPIVDGQSYWFDLVSY